MENDMHRHHGRSIYWGIGVLAIVILFGSLLFIENEVWRGAAIGLAVELFGVAAIFFIIDLFGWNPSQPSQQQMTAQLQQMVEVTERIRQASKGNVDIYTTRQAVWDTSLTMVRKQQWNKLRLFAPVGLWREDESKKLWLQEVAKSVSGSSRQVNILFAIYGLPPKSRYGFDRSIDDVKKDLGYLKELLKPFNLPHVELHYYPPMPVSVALGAIILEDKTQARGPVAFALSSQIHEELVDCAFSVEDNQQLFSLTKAWFDDRLFWGTTRNFILHDKDKSLGERWNDIYFTRAQMIKG